MVPEDPTPGQLRAMVLLSTLRTAAEVRHAIEERRQGRDPSAQEAEQPARAFLAEATEELRALEARLRLSLAAEPEAHAALVRAFEDRLALARAARVLHLAHQRLLSLYAGRLPEAAAIPEALLEAVRLRQREAERLAVAGGPSFRRALALWLDRTAALCEALSKALQEPN